MEALGALWLTRRWQKVKGETFTIIKVPRRKRGKNNTRRQGTRICKVSCALLSQKTRERETQFGCCLNPLCSVRRLIEREEEKGMEVRRERLEGVLMETCHATSHLPKTGSRGREGKEGEICPFDL